MSFDDLQNKPMRCSRQTCRLCCLVSSTHQPSHLAQHEQGIMNKCVPSPQFTMEWLGIHKFGTINLLCLTFPPQYYCLKFIIPLFVCHDIISRRLSNEYYGPLNTCPRYASRFSSAFTLCFNKGHFVLGRTAHDLGFGACCTAPFLFYKWHSSAITYHLSSPPLFLALFVLISVNFKFFSANLGTLSGINPTERLQLTFQKNPWCIRRIPDWLLITVSRYR